MVAFLFQFLRQVNVGGLNEVGMILAHETHHLIIVSLFLVHGNGQVGLLDADVEFFRLLEFALLLQFLCLRYVHRANVGGLHVILGQCVSLFPHSRGVVHFNSLPMHAAIKVKSFCHFVFANTGKMLTQFVMIFVEFAVVIINYLDNLYCLLPLSGIDGGLKRLQCAASFDIMVDGSIKLFIVC